MLGAIVGDIVGSVYEWNNIKTKDFPLFLENCFFHGWYGKSEPLNVWACWRNEVKRQNNETKTPLFRYDNLNWF